jgi:protein SCO1/2
MSTTGKSPAILRLGALLSAVLALAGGYWLADQLLGKTPDLSGVHATVFREPRAITPFTLVDHTGKRFDNRSLQGRWSFVFFGYTHCPDVCPTTLSVLNSVARKLETEKDRVQYVFISIDPGRDTPEQLAQFVSYFNGSFIGATGSADALEGLTRQLGVIYARVPANPGTQNTATANDYLMDHSASVLLFDPAGRFHAVFTPPLDARSMSDDFKAISDAYR